MAKIVNNARIITEGMYKFSSSEIARNGTKKRHNSEILLIPPAIIDIANNIVRMKYGKIFLETRKNLFLTIVNINKSIDGKNMNNRNRIKYSIFASVKKNKRILTAVRKNDIIKKPVMHSFLIFVNLKYLLYILDHITEIYETFFSNSRYLPGEFFRNTY